MRFLLTALLFSLVWFFPVLPPGFEPSHNLFLISLVTRSVVAFTPKGVRKVLLLNEVLRVVMSIFISLAIADVFH